MTVQKMQELQKLVEESKNASIPKVRGSYAEHIVDYVSRSTRLCSQEELRKLIQTAQDTMIELYQNETDADARCNIAVSAADLALNNSLVKHQSENEVYTHAGKSCDDLIELFKSEKNGGVQYTLLKQIGRIISDIYYPNSEEGRPSFIKESLQKLVKLRDETSDEDDQNLVQKRITKLLKKDGPQYYLSIDDYVHAGLFSEWINDAKSIFITGEFLYSNRDIENQREKIDLLLTNVYAYNELKIFKNNSPEANQPYDALKANDLFKENKKLSKACEGIHAVRRNYGLLP